MRQNLLERNAVAAISELDGEIPIRNGRAHLKSKGLLPSPEDLVEIGELEFTRKVFRAAKRYENPEETGKLSFAHITIALEDGTKREYYKKLQETTVDEAVHDLEYMYKYVGSGVNRLRSRFKEYCKIHGKRKIQRRLTFKIPAPETKIV